jgi:hypothetical protein
VGGSRRMPLVHPSTEPFSLDARSAHGNTRGELPNTAQVAQDIVFCEWGGLENASHAGTNVQFWRGF